jgi:hypothetical protein
LEEFDAFMQDEHIQSDIRAGDGLVHFAQERWAWIWQTPGFEELQAQVDKLLEDDIISKEVHAQPREVVSSQEPSSIGQEASELSQQLSCILEVVFLG